MWMILLIFSAVAGAAFLFTGSLSPAQSAVAGRISELESSAKPRGSQFGLLKRLATLLDPALKGRELTRVLDRMLYQAGWAWAPGEFLMATFLLSLAAGLMGGMLTGNLLIGMGAAVGGAVTPMLQLSSKRRKMLQAFNEQLPDALMLVINSLRAGNSFLQAMQLVAKQMGGSGDSGKPSVISQEFAMTVAEINWGLSVERALTNLAERIGTVDIDLLAAAILVQRETGGNLVEVLQQMHDTIRDRIRIAGEVQALTAQGRLSGYVLTALPLGVGILFFLISPGYLNVLFNDPRGHMLLAAATGLQALGMYAIRRIVTIRY